MEDLGERVAQLLGSEEGMEQVRQLMASLSGGDGGPDLSSLLGMLGGAGGENGNCSPSGQQQNSFGDRMMKLMELLPVLQQSGLLSGLLGGEENG